MWSVYHHQSGTYTGDRQPTGDDMTEDNLDRKGMQVSVQVWKTLTSLKRGNQTYTDVIIEVLEKAKIPLVK
jgi:hypothetical protein